jgi:adenylate cyclase
VKDRRFALWALAIAAIALVADVAWFRLLRDYDHDIGDSLMRLAARTHPADPEFTMLVADERSVAILGEEVDRWPWPREVFGIVARAIAAQKPRAIVFDMVFADVDRARMQSDAALGRMLAEIPNVYIAVLRSDPAGDSYGISMPALAPYVGLDPAAAPDVKADILLPRALPRDVWRLGAINFIGDDDGVGRRYPIYLDVFGWRLPSLAARVARDLGYEIPDRKDIILAWPATPHPIVPFVDVWDDVQRTARGEATKRPGNEFTDKVVLIGAHATGVPDVHPTPLAKTHFGLDFIATALDNLKHRDYVDTAPRYVTVAIGLALLALVWYGYATRRNSVKIGAALLVASAALFAAGYFALHRRVLLDLATPLACAWAYYAAIAVKTYVAERDLRRRTTETFSRFVNPVVVEQLMSEGGFSRTPQARDVTVLFCDIRGFTTMSEWLEPKALIDLLNHHFSRHVEIIFRHGGTLDKFIGDAMMALWGAPIEDPRHAQHAVACALEMREALLAFRRELPPELAHFDIGIGIHSGTAIVGLVGPEQRPEYTAVGDTVNVASRIEGLTANLPDMLAQAEGGTANLPEGCRILVSEATRQRAGDAFDFLPVGQYKVKGRASEVQLFQPRRRT